MEFSEDSSLYHGCNIVIIYEYAEESMVIQDISKLPSVIVIIYRDPKYSPLTDIIEVIENCSVKIVIEDEICKIHIKDL